MRTCATCGKRLPVDPLRRIYSRWTRSWYCTDINACHKRAARRRKKVRP